MLSCVREVHPALQLKKGLLPMSATQSSAKAYEMLSILSSQREAWHRARFAAVKQRRAIKDFRTEMGLIGHITSELETCLNSLDEICLAERQFAWDKITGLDAEIDTLTHQLNVGVYDAS